MPAPRGHFRIGVERSVGTIDAGKDGLQPIVVFLRNRIELVVVAAGTMGRETQECRHRGHHHVIAIVRPGDVLVDRSLAQFDVTYIIPGAGGDETGRDHGLRIVAIEHVARQLFGDEPRVRLVFVERRE